MHDFTAQVVANPKSAAEKLVAAYTSAKACQEDAAKLMNASLWTWLSWVERLDLHARLEEVEKRAKAEGWHHGRTGGRPPSTGKRKTARRAQT